MTVSFSALPLMQPPFPSRRDQRILALVFPHLPTDRIARRRWGLSWRSTGRPEHPPVACVAKHKSAMRLTALDEVAESIGFKRGQGVAEARAMSPDLDVIAADEAADLRFLEAIADWCDRYTPLVALDQPDGLFLDITGCAHLFGGEQALLDNILTRLFHMGLDVRGAIAPSPGLAWACSRFGGPAVSFQGDEARILAPMPLACLRLSAELLLTLSKSGLKRVGDILGAPRAPLARRFGPEPLLRLDQALGSAGESVSPRRPVAILSAERRLSEPVGEEDDLLHLAGQLAGSLKSGFEARGEGGLQFELLLFRVDGKVFRILAGASLPTRDPARIGGLFRERFAALHESYDAGYGFEMLRLNVLQAAPSRQHQPDFTGEEDEDRSFAAFVDRVSARLGPDCLRVPVTRESHWPERASVLMPAGEAADCLPAAGEPRPPPFRAERPLRIFRYPEPVEAMADVPEGPPVHFRWRRALHRVLRAEGPERLAAEWWIDGEAHPTRDYFRIEDEAGRRFWLFREGLYEREAGVPRWFLHGVFA
jgi:protein ImuB